MTELDFLILILHLFEVSQIYSFCSSALTTFSSDVRCLSGYRMLVSSAKR